jgi:carbamoyltransferase
MALAAYGGRHPKVDHLDIAASRRQFGDIVISHEAACDRLEALIEEAWNENASRQAIDPMSERGINICREGQAVLQEEMLHLARVAREKTGSRRLCLAGGVALSCVTNRYLYDNAGFDDMFIQPAASDEGIALGCALHGYHLARGGKRRAHMTTSYLGRANDTGRLEATLERYNLSYRRAGAGEIAGLLARGKIVGRVAGAAEYGPRALGNRSILADPRDPEMRDRINRDIKHRELFRPFAPSCHEDKRERYFDLPMRSPFMIMACQVRQDMRETLPSVLHVDGSSRVQTVTREQNEGYWELIEEFGKLTGIYVLLNTSFNDRGEAIVESYEDAIVSFCSCGLDYLYVDGYLVEPPPHADILKSRLAEEIGRDERARYEALAAEFCDGEKLAALTSELDSQAAPRSAVKIHGRG